MLRKDEKAADRAWSGAHRALAASMLLAVAVGRRCCTAGPARTTRANAPVESKVAGNVLERTVEPFDLSYVADDESQAIVAFRPAAAFRRAGMGLHRTALNVWIAQKWAKAANTLKFDPTQPGQGPLKVESSSRSRPACGSPGRTARNPTGESC